MTITSSQTGAFTSAPFLLRRRSRFVQSPAGLLGIRTKSAAVAIRTLREEVKHDAFCGQGGRGDRRRRRNRRGDIATLRRGRCQGRRIRPQSRRRREGRSRHPGRRRDRRSLRLRHRQEGGRRCSGRRGRSEARPYQRVGQQRRLGRVPALRQDRARPVGQAHRDQSDRRLAHASCGAARDGGAQVGPHRQHRVRRRPRRLVGRGGLRGLQGRPRRVLQDNCARAFAPRNHGQCRLPGPDRHCAVRRVQGRRRQSGEAGRGLHPLDPARSRSAASASRTTCPARSCSSPATTPPTSPARC